MQHENMHADVKTNKSKIVEITLINYAGIWSPGEWSECSVEHTPGSPACGFGSQTRSAKIIEFNGKIPFVNAGMYHVYCSPLGLDNKQTPITAKILLNQQWSVFVLSGTKGSIENCIKN